MPKKFIFILGCWRTGTTYVLSLLKDYPNITHITAEKVGLARIRNSWETGVFLKFPIDKAIEKINQVEGDILVEKTPSHHAKIKEILEGVPNCNIISVVRNPLDVATSFMNSKFIKITKYIETAIFEYNRSAENILSIEDKRLILLDYKDLIHRPYTNFSRLIKELDLPKINQGTLREIILNNQQGQKIPTEGVYRNINYATEKFLTAKEASKVAEKCWDNYKKLLQKI